MRLLLAVLVVVLFSACKSAPIEITNDTAPERPNNSAIIQDEIKRGIAGPEMILIPGGSFQMGDTTNVGEADEKPVHTVRVKSFYMSKFEITQRQWNALRQSGASFFEGDNRPVENVSLKRIKAFIKLLNSKTGRNYRLPTEAEWEYAARAGSTSNYSWGNNVGENRANCRDCGSLWDGKETAPVGSFQQNAFGLYDMHGNVWEWVQDNRHNDYHNAPADSSAWGETSKECCCQFVLRGGSWDSVSADIRSANRFWYGKEKGLKIYGFRLALTP